MDKVYGGFIIKQGFDFRAAQRAEVCGFLLRIAISDQGSSWSGR